ncbi:serine hydrolase domain-containing protein [Algiphilus aromaticivorans]|uniref:serine hydrolase domain-containing protein n=1 Tax=Algiphilus aromaticivorans TaxID=382454 RepID=UPI000694789F|nr:serine hydrolase [Algiphilus aromaticivorans]
MEASVWRRLAGVFVVSLALVACGSSGDQSQADVQGPDDTGAEPPNEGVILAQELAHMVERAGLLSLPTDLETVQNAITTLPNGLGDVVAMHVGRLYATPNDALPAVGPLLDLLQARLELLLGGEQATRLAQDLADGEASILLLPVDATTVIVILPTQVVKAAPSGPALPEAKVDLGQITYEVNGRTRTVDEFMQSGTTNAIGFMHNGQFIYEDYQNGYNPDTRAHMWSVTKSVTTALVGIAVSEGLVDSIHDPIKKYIPDAADTVWEGVTVEDLLQMESGTYWVDVPVHQPEQLVLMGADFHTNGLFGMTRDEYLLRLTRVSEPGEFYRYNSGDAQMLAWLLENVYDRPYAEILSEKIWRPAGMQDDALVAVDRLGNTFASMGLMATPRDMLRFGEIFRNGGRTFDGLQIVPEAWVEASHNYDKANGGGPRGYMWPHWGGVESGNYTAAGYGHQRVSVAPSLNMVGVRFGNDPVDSVAPKEWDALLTAVGNYLQFGETQ